MSEERSIHIQDLLEKNKLDESDILIVQDTENTKQVTLRNLIISMIKDNDVPTNYRIYSSEKIQGMIDTLEKYLEKGVGLINNEVEKLQKDKVSNDTLEKLKDELQKELDDRVVAEEFNKALDGKRDKNTKLNCNDFDTSSDSAKIKLENLSEEVILAMTGNTIVIPTNKAPIGGWVREDLADGLINFNKLDPSYRFAGIIKEGNINELTEDGVYLLGSGVLGLPKMDNETEDNSRILDVTRIGDTLIMQSVYYCNDSEDRPIFRRKGNINRLHVIDFNEVHEVTDTFKVSRNMLSDDFGDCGIIDSGSVFTIRKEGNYYATKNVKDLPEENTNFMVKVSKYNDKYVFDAQSMDTNVCNYYKSLLYFTTGQMPVTTEWFKISSTDKSKFDNKKVYLFGDGILFGLGSDDYSNKSIQAVLQNKYGMVVNNRSIGDATFGDYDDEILQEYSVLKQIQTTPLEDADYIIIMAGTNDWAIGRGPINKSDTAKNNLYFNSSINLCLERIFIANPSVKVLLCTPIFRSRIEYGDNKNSDDYSVNDKYLQDYVDCMKRVAVLNHVPCVDLLATSGINRYTASTYLKDGLHPNDIGNALLADKIYDAMNMYY